MTQRISVASIDPERLRGVIGDERADRFGATAQDVRQAIGDRVVLSMNSTASGGGVAEMLPQMLGYARGAGVDARWSVLDGNPDFFAVTKRLHNMLHGSAGDGGSLHGPERDAYERVLADASADLDAELAAGDIAVLHDPQTLGLAPRLRRRGVRVVWRCHVGSTTTDEHTEQAWQFLEPYFDHVDRFVFSVETFAPGAVAADEVTIIPPSLDPLAAKNRPLSDGDVRDVLAHCGLVQGSTGGPVRIRGDGPPVDVRRRADLVQLGPPPPPDAPLVVQVSRWDRLKDMEGVLQGFADHVADLDDVHLVLAGPNVSGVADDPEATAELQRCIDLWRTLPHERRARVHLACLPVADRDENAVIVNALQRAATVVTQKSLAEGFGLTVAEAMWKGRPVVASAVGGIPSQIDDGDSGLLLQDPTDLAGFGHLVRRCLDTGVSGPIGRAAADRASTFLPDLQLERWASVVRAVLG
ncbi:glycosyltransferase [Nakamurella endophytica]|uniref:Glycosyl transferase family 1 n=1 Tax=Nakamurella endophytica TaxID=1748367 RepID=A0A917SRR5_9ACTN|nr:glycosyltransferase [Nakamurella endophytica]GGL92914.1 glycosyl transferase family 1 [Nakamurella endophytica]